MEDSEKQVTNSISHPAPGPEGKQWRHFQEQFIFSSLSSTETLKVGHSVRTSPPELEEVHKPVDAHIVTSQTWEARESKSMWLSP